MADQEARNRVVRNVWHHIVYDLGGIANTRVDLFGADLHDFMKATVRRDGHSDGSKIVCRDHG